MDNYREILKRFKYESSEHIEMRLTNVDDENVREEQDILNEIVLWKINRTVHISESTIELLKSFDYLKTPMDAVYDARVKDLVSKLLLSKGIGMPVASAILHFYYKDIFPIVDQRSYRTLYGKDYPQYTTKNKNQKYIDMYIKYIEDCYFFNVEKCPDIPFNLVDKIFYQIDKEKKNKVRY